MTDEAPAPETKPPTTNNWPMWVLGLVIMIDQVDQNIVRGAQNEIARDLALSDTQVGLLLSCFVLVNGLISVPAGYLADRWNRTRTIGHTVIGWSGITAVTAAAPNYAVAHRHPVRPRVRPGDHRAVDGQSLLADYYPLEKRGKAFSVQQVLVFLGFGIGLAGGGIVSATLGWRWSFLIVGTPGVVIAFFVYQLREPHRGEADRLSMGLSDGGSEPRAPRPHGRGARAVHQGPRSPGCGPTCGRSCRSRRCATPSSACRRCCSRSPPSAPPSRRSTSATSGSKPGKAESFVGAILVLGGIPGVLLGGRLADRYATRIKGARMAIPAYCVLAGQTVFVLSYLKLPLAPTFALQALGAFIISLAVPALRAGLSDAVPANLRGAGFGAFNLVSVILGQAAAAIIVFTIADIFGDNLRTALLVVSPPVFIGGLIFLRAKDHMDEDAAKIFQAIMTAMQEQQAREAAEAAALAQGDAAAEGDPG